MREDIKCVERKIILSGIREAFISHFPSLISCRFTGGVSRYSEYNTPLIEQCTVIFIELATKIEEVGEGGSSMGLPSAVWLVT